MQESVSIHETLPGLPKEAIPEVKVYLEECWGSRSRIDYGSGMELNFLCWMCVSAYVEIDLAHGSAQALPRALGRLPRDGPCRDCYACVLEVRPLHSPNEQSDDIGSKIYSGNALLAVNVLAGTSRLAWSVGLRRLSLPPVCLRFSPTQR